MNQNIDITGKNKAAILAALYNNSRPLRLGILHYKKEDMTEAQAGDELKAGNYFDYLHGRVMKIDLGKDTLSTRLYDRDNGEGAGFEAIKHLL